VTVEIKRQPTSNPTPAEKREELLKDPGFGRLFSDHMIQARYEEGKGWFEAKLCERAPLSFDPSTNVFHYGQAVFEGMKVYKRADGSFGTFRAEEHAERMMNSAKRLAMPPVPKELFLGSIKALVEQDRDWIPQGAGESFYLRPTLIGTDEFLGVRPSKTYLFFLIGSPSASYFSKGASAVDVWITRDFSRAGPGGTGAAKAAGNYAGSLLAQEEAIKNGCQQVLWLDAPERKYVEEMGGMNVFFVFGDELVTPPLTDTILPGITRRSLLTLAEKAGHKVTERRLTFDEILDAHEKGIMTEAFACGTAAVVTPIGAFRWEGGHRVLADGAGPLGEKLRATLLGIQHGTVPDTFGWTQRVA